MIKIEISVTNIEKTNEIASQIMDRLFTVYGYEKNSHFDDHYDLIKHK
jgi:hypothetical protein